MKGRITREKRDSVGYMRVEPSLIKAEHRATYLKRRHAMELKLDGVTGSEIREITGVAESEVVRFFKRYTEINDDGVFWGEASLIPRSRVVAYKRTKNFEKKNSEQQGGLAGVLNYTLAAHPSVERDFICAVLKSSESGQGVRHSKTHLCHIFYDLCSLAGIGDDQWPFNQPRGVKKTISTYVDKILNDNFMRAAYALGGKDAVVHSKVGTGKMPLLADFDVYDIIEVDSYHVDAFFSLNISGDKRTKTKDVVSRIWLIAAICRRSNAILAISFVFSSEIRAQDLVDLLCAAYLGRWTPRQTLSIKGLHYIDGSGMPGYVLPSLRSHTWGGVYLDNAMQHHAKAVYDLALHELGFALNYGPLGQPARRPNVERLFKRIATKVMHQIPSTTGSSPHDGRSEDPEKAAIRYQIDVDEALEVMDVYTANYNNVPQGGKNKASSPLDILRGYCESPNLIHPASSESYLSTINLGGLTRQVTVRGSVEKGIRPRVKLDQALYTSTLLANSPGLIGKKLTVRITPHDYRYVEAFLDDGVYFDKLTVEAAWRYEPHSVTTRKLINRALAKKEFRVAEGQHPVLAWQKHLAANATPANNRESKRLFNEITQEANTNLEASIGLSSPLPAVEEARWKNLDFFKVR